MSARRGTSYFGYLPVFGEADLDDLPNVDITGREDESALVWNSTVEKWVCKLLSSTVVVVTQAEVDAGVFESADSSKLYLIDGILDLNGHTIVVPADGLRLQGHGYNLSKLTTTTDGSTIFTSASGGSGDLFLSRITIDAQGSGTSVFALEDVSGVHAIELDQVNFDNCASLGYIDGYRQGLELNTGRFGGTPSLEFRGTWAGGYAIRVSIAVGLTDASYALFSSALGHTFATRFGGDPNITLPSSVLFYQGTESNFVSDAGLQLKDARFGGSGAVLSGIASSSRKAEISSSSGVLNTYVGGFWSVTGETATTFSGSGTDTKLNGTTTYESLAWFSDGGGSNSMTLVTSIPVQVEATFSGNFSGGNNKVIRLKLRRYVDSTSSYSDIASTSFTTNGSGRFESVTLVSRRFSLEENDRVEMWAANLSDTSSLTMSLNSSLRVDISSTA